MNHIHIDNFIDRPVGNIEDIIEQGVRYAFAMQDLLSRSGSFKVILGYTSDPMIDCNVRFHKIRPGVEWVTDDLEGYEDAVLV